MTGKFLDTQILVVDDLPGILDAIDAIFGDIYSVITRNNVFDAVETFQESRTDIIISDFEMPGQNGVDLYYTVRNQGFMGTFIFFTAFSNDKVRRIVKCDPLAKLIKKPELKRLENTISESIFKKGR